MAEIWAAVPVKEFAGAKQRLAPMLTAAQREALAAAMLEDVLAALAATPTLAGIVVNTIDPLATELAWRYGARVITEGAREGHTGAVTAMARVLAAEGHDMLTVPGDIPRVTATEVAAVIEARRPAPSVTIVPAHDERGSNAVLCSPPLVMPLRFGDDSFKPHLATARALGIEPTILRLSGIGLDIDQPGDVRALLRAEPPRQTRALSSLRGA